MQLRASLCAAVAAAATLLVAVPTAFSAALPAPKPVLPANNAPVRYLPAFQWTPVAGVDHYEFEIAADAGFNAPVDERQGRPLRHLEHARVAEAGHSQRRVLVARARRAQERLAVQVVGPAQLPDGVERRARPPQAGRRRHGQLPAARHARVVAGRGREEVQGPARLRPRARLAGLQAHRRLHAGDALHARGAARAGHVLLEHHAGRRARPRGRRVGRVVVHLGLAVHDGSGGHDGRGHPPERGVRERPALRLAARAGRRELRARDQLVGGLRRGLQGLLRERHRSSATPHTPTKLLPQNTYYWRVRAVDSSQNAGRLEPAGGAVPHGRHVVRADAGHGHRPRDPQQHAARRPTTTTTPVHRRGQTTMPIVTCGSDPRRVALPDRRRAALGQLLQLRRRRGQRVERPPAIPSWTPLGANRNTAADPFSNPQDISADSKPMVPGNTYCVRVRPEMDRVGVNDAAVRRLQRT